MGRCVCTLHVETPAHRLSTGQDEDTEADRTVGDSSDASSETDESGTGSDEETETSGAAGSGSDSGGDGSEAGGDDGE